MVHSHDFFKILRASILICFLKEFVSLKADICSHFLFSCFFFFLFDINWTLQFDINNAYLFACKNAPNIGKFIKNLQQTIRQKINPFSTRLTGVVLSNPEPDRKKQILKTALASILISRFATSKLLQVNKSSKIHPIKAFALFREYSLRNP